MDITINIYDHSYKYSEMVGFINSIAELKLVIIEGTDHNFKNMDECFHDLPEAYLLN